MFIDISTYIGHWPFRNLKYNTLEGLDQLAQRYDITHMVVANLNGVFYKDVNYANLELLEELKKYNGKTKFLPMAIVNPILPACEKDARDIIAAGFAGLEICPFYHRYSLAPEFLYDTYYPVHRAGQVLALAEELDVPVRICGSFEDPRGRSELDTREAIKGEDLYALLSKNEKTHVFVTSFDPNAAGEKIGKRRNTYFDTTRSFVFNKEKGKRVMQFIEPEQLCFGSLSPFIYMESNLLKAEFTPEFDCEMMKVAAARAFKELDKI